MVHQYSLVIDDDDRRSAILRYAAWAAIFPVSQGGPVTLR